MESRRRTNSRGGLEGHFRASRLRAKARALRMLVLATLVLAMLLPASAFAGVASVAAKVVVRGESIRASELVRLSEPSPDLLQQLELAELGPAPRPGESLVLPRGTLLTRLRSALPLAASMQWQIPERVTVVRASTRVELNAIVEALQRFVEENQAIPVQGLRLEAIQVSAPVLVQEGEVSLDFEALAGEDLLGPTSLTLVIRVDGQEAARRPLRVRIDGSVSLWITTRALRRGQEITEFDLAQELRPASSAPRQPILNRDEALGMLARRALSPNQVLDLGDVEAKALIKRKDPVTLLIRTSNMILTCPGEALEDGRPGESVLVVNSGTRKQLRGRVVGTGEVEIDYRPPSEFMRTAAQRP